MGTQLWSDRQVTVRVEGPDGERTVEVGKPYARIGSDQRAEVILEGPSVPRLGLYLHATDDGVFCTSLTKPRASVEGNGHHGYGEWLSDTRSTSLGDYKIYASFTEGTAPQVDAMPALSQKGHAPLPIPVIGILVENQRRGVYRAHRSLTIVGRSDPSDLRLKSEFVSSTHCTCTGPMAGCGSLTC